MCMYKKLCEVHAIRSSKKGIQALFAKLMVYLRSMLGMSKCS